MEFLRMLKNNIKNHTIFIPWVDLILKIISKSQIDSIRPLNQDRTYTSYFQTSEKFEHYLKIYQKMTKNTKVLYYLNIHRTLLIYTNNNVSL